MRIAIFETEAWENQTFDRLNAVHQLEFSEHPLTTQGAGRYQEAEVISPFIYSEMGAETLQALPQLKLIATRSTGTDHIDLDACRKRNIAVSNVPTYGENTVAEHVFGLLLTISHNLHLALDRTRRGDFSLQGLRGFDLRGKVLGVVGTGAIGRCVIEIARGFGMEVLATDVQPDKALAKRLGFQYTDLPGLLKAADVITLHVPALAATHHLIGPEQFARMKDGVVLINTARGSIVDTQALIRALADGKLRAAGLDVLPEEPVIREEAELIRSLFRKRHDLENLLAGHILLRLRNVVITPHSAFNTREAIGRILETTVENIAAFIGGGAQNRVA